MSEAFSFGFSGDDFEENTSHEQGQASVDRDAIDWHVEPSMKPELLKLDHLVSRNFQYTPAPNGGLYAVVA